MELINSQIYICFSACRQGAGHPACSNFMDEIIAYNDENEATLPLPAKLPEGLERTISNIEARFIGRSMDHLKELVHEEIRADMSDYPNRISDHPLHRVLIAADKFTSTIHQSPNQGADKETGFIDTGRPFPPRYYR